MVDRTKQVIRQTKALVFEGNTKAPDKLVSVFEPHTEVIRKGKVSKSTEFGKMVKIQEAENQMVIHYEVFDDRPNDADLLVDSLRTHEERCSEPQIWWRPTRRSTRMPMKKRWRWPG